MSASFVLDVDPACNLVRIRMGGFFTPDDIAAFAEARDAAHAQLRCGPTQHVTLNDLRGMKIQSQEAVESFRALLASPAHRSRKLAFVMGRTLARTQLLRALDRRVARCFETTAEAEAWLFVEDDAQAA